MRTIEYKGIEVAYDDSVTHSWKWQKAVASGDPSRSISAVERLLMGRDEEYAEALGDDADAMTGLLAAVMEDMGSTAKN